MVVSFSQETHSRYECLTATLAEDLSIKQRMKQTWTGRIQGTRRWSELEGTGPSIEKKLTTRENGPFRYGAYGLSVVNRTKFPFNLIFCLDQS